MRSITNKAGAPFLALASIGRFASRHWLNVSWWCCVLLWALLSAPSTSLGREYEVDGEITQTNFKPDGSVRNVQHSKFTVSVKDCSWLIQTTNLDQGGNRLSDVVTSHAGTNQVCSVIRTAPEKWWPVESIPGDLPIGHGDGNLMCHLWLMFASDCYFASLSTNWLTPVYDSNASATIDPNLKRRAKWRLINGPGSLPFGVKYMKGDYDVDATYLHTGLTNVADMRFPNGFVFEQRVSRRFAPGPILSPGAAPAYHILKRAVASVTAIRPFCARTEFTPVVTAGVLRFER